MKISRKEVDHVARLELTEEEKEKFTGQLEHILLYIDQLNKIDTATIAPPSHVVALTNVWRNDECKPSTPEEIERLLANAPEREGQFFKVRKVIE